MAMSGVYDLVEATKLVTDQTVWQIAMLPKEGDQKIPIVMGDVFHEPYIAINWAMKLNKGDTKNVYWVIERTIAGAKFAYEGKEMPQEVADEW